MSLFSAFSVFPQMPFLLCIVVYGMDTWHTIWSLLSVVFPRILEGPRSSVCTAGGPCNLTCSVEGVPLPTVTWSQNGSPVPKASLVETEPSSFYSGVSTILFKDVSLGNAGSYGCQASNLLVEHMSASSSDAVLTVHCEFSLSWESIVALDKHGT